jgi:glycosyltransferase involved in cell wall biosynthesis
MYENSSNRPVISIVVEGYNETRDLGTVDSTMAALSAQDFPLDRIEVILVGSEDQARYWKKTHAEKTRFHSVKVVAMDTLNYYELKNGGGEIAAGDIIAFTDSDVHPRETWVSAIIGSIDGGADVTVGPSLFHKRNGFPLSPDSPVMRTAASLTWGWIMGKRQNGPIPQARGFMDHNVALRADAFHNHQYRTDLGRIIASSLLFRELINAGLRVVISPGQQAAHHFSWRYWLISLHFRYGHEVFRLRRLDPEYPNQWISRTGILEPLITLVWHMMLDVPRWFRFAGILGAGLGYCWGLLPLLVLMSTAARGAEMLGMYATILAPEKTQKWAENV